MEVKDEISCEVGRVRDGREGERQMKKEAWFGLSILALVLIGLFVLMPSPDKITNGHLGLLMLALIVC